MADEFSSFLRKNRVEQSVIQGLDDQGVTSIEILKTLKADDLAGLGMKKTSAKSLLNAAENYGLETKGIKISGRNLKGNIVAGGGGSVTIEADNVSGNIVCGGVNHGNVNNSTVTTYIETNVSRVQSFTVRISNGNLTPQDLTCNLPLNTPTKKFREWLTKRGITDFVLDGYNPAVGDYLQDGVVVVKRKTKTFTVRFSDGDETRDLTCVLSPDTPTKDFREWLKDQGIADGDLGGYNPTVGDYIKDDVVDVKRRKPDPSEDSIQTKKPKTSEETKKPEPSEGSTLVGQFKNFIEKFGVDELTEKIKRQEEQIKRQEEQIKESEKRISCISQIVSRTPEKAKKIVEKNGYRMEIGYKDGEFVNRGNGDRADPVLIVVSVVNGKIEGQNINDPRGNKYWRPAAKFAMPL